MRKFVDEREPDKILTEWDLHLEFLWDDTLDPGITFAEWLTNCMDFRDGTLKEVTNFAV